MLEGLKKSHVSFRHPSDQSSGTNDRHGPSHAAWHVIARREVRAAILRTSEVFICRRHGC